MEIVEFLKVMELTMFMMCMKQTDIRYTTSGMIGMEGGYLSMLGKWPSNDRTDDNIVIRVEEMHLIYAEAMLRAGDAATAKTYLNNVQAIRGATLTDATLDNIILERRREFFGEGHRFYDIARIRNGYAFVNVFDQTI